MGRMKFIDLFAGIGGFRRGLELAGHQCVGFCEFDKFAVASYTAMHLLTDSQRIKLKDLSLKDRQKEILKDEYRNGEWYANDIRNVHASELPGADCWCFGAPCQDFSIAGKRAGLDGDRSSLIREIFRLLEEQEEQDRPEWIIYENVKGMLSSNKGLDYLSILSEMDRLGYDIEWQNINSRWFVPQNRERIYTVGHHRRYGSAKILPIKGADGENSISMIAHRDNYRENTKVFSKDGISEALQTCQGGGRVPCTAIPYFIDMNSGAGIKKTDIARTLRASYSKGIPNHSGEASGVAIPILTPNRSSKMQNGRRFKENGEPMFTLTTQDIHGVGINISGHSVTKLTNVCSCLNANDQRKIFGAKQSRTLVAMGYDTQKDKSGIFVETPDGFVVYAVWYEKENCYIAIRRLTPKECFRLQGWSDDYFERAVMVCSDTQLYKQAGNGVTVPVVEAIGKAIKEK